MLNLKSKWVRLSAGFATGAVLLWASGIAPQAYNLIEGNGTPAARGSTLNFANTASVTWSCTTTGIVTACSATASGGGGSGGGSITLGTVHFHIMENATNVGAFATMSKIDLRNKLGQPIIDALNEMYKLGRRPNFAMQKI